MILRSPLVPTVILLTSCGVLSTFASVGCAQPDPAADQTVGQPAISKEEISERLTARLGQLNQISERISAMIAQLEEGAEPGDLLGPDDRWLLNRGNRNTGPFGGPLGGPEGDFGERGRRGARTRPGDGGDRGFDRGPGREGPSREMTESQLSEIREIIDQHLPLIAERLRVAEENDSEAADRFLARLAPRFRDILELKKNAPEMVDVRIEELRVGMAIVNASREFRRLYDSSPESAEATEKKAEIREMLVRQFDLRQQLERHRLEQQVAQLADARAKLEEQAQSRDTVVDGHLERVIKRTIEADGRDPRRGGRREGRPSDRPDRPRD